MIKIQKQQTHTGACVDLLQRLQHYVGTLRATPQACAPLRQPPNHRISGSPRPCARLHSVPCTPPTCKPASQSCLSVTFQKEKMAKGNKVVINTPKAEVAADRMRRQTPLHPRQCESMHAFAGEDNDMRESRLPRNLLSPIRGPCTVHDISNGQASKQRNGRGRFAARSGTIQGIPSTQAN